MAEPANPIATVDTSKRSITVRVTIPKEAAKDAHSFAGTPLSEQQARLLVHLPSAIAVAKATAIALAPEVGLTERIGLVEVWDSFAAGVEVVINWGKGTIDAIAVGVTWTF